MSKLLSDLKAVRALLTDPAHWTQSVSARDAKGVSVSCVYSQAVSFCLYGACLRVGATVNPLMTRLGRELGSGAPYDIKDVLDFNDNHSHAEVLDLLDATIRKEENNEPASQ